MRNQRNFLLEQERSRKNKERIGLRDNKCNYHNHCFHKERWCNCGDSCPTPPNTGAPNTITELLNNSINDNIQLTTPFGVVTGTLIAVKDDYVVIVESNGDQTLVRTNKIEFVGEM